MRLAIPLCALAALVLGTAPGVADARKARLGTPEVITSLSGESNLIGSSSVAGHGDAYAVFHQIIGANIYSVVYRDDHGHAHRFDLPDTRTSYPEGIRLAALEAGGGIAVWDNNHRVLARSWQRDGTLGPIQVVLSQVSTVHSADNDYPQWQMRADSNGTVVVATTGMPYNNGSVIAAVRDPGGQFGPQQVLTPSDEPAVDQRQIRISPIAADGTVVVAWGPESGDGPGGRATRSARSPVFGAPSAAPFTAQTGLTTATRSFVTADGSPVTITAALARSCPCVNAHVFSWAGGVRVLAFQTYPSVTSYEVSGWFVSHPNADGAFDTAVEATQKSYAFAVRRTTPGEIGFASFDTNTDYDLYRQRSRLIVVPFGPHVPLSRSAPRLGFGSFASARAGHLLVGIFCDRVCRIHGSSGGARLPLVDSEGKRTSDLIEAFSVVYLRLTLTGRATAQISIGATDDAGHRSAATATFARTSRAGQWCRTGTSRC